MDNGFTQGAFVLFVKVLPGVAHLKQSPKRGRNTHSNKSCLRGKQRCGQLRLADFSEPHLIHRTWATMRTAKRMLKLRPLSFRGHRDLTHVGIKDEAALTALKVDEHRLQCVR